MKMAKKWAKVLELGDWELEITVVNGWDEDYEGFVKYDIRDKSAKIYIFPENLNKKDPNAAEKVILHELSEVVVGVLFQKLPDDMFDSEDMVEARDMMAETLTRILFKFAKSKLIR